MAVAGTDAKSAATCCRLEHGECWKVDRFGSVVGYGDGNDDHGEKEVKRSFNVCRPWWLIQ